MAASSLPATTRPRILVDGVFFQFTQTGISRLWKSYLEQWARTDFARHLVVLDRRGTAPRVPGLSYHDVPGFDLDDLGRETLQIETWCQELQADLYVSTYYSTPVRTRSTMMVYDMIFEIETGDASQVWGGEKVMALLHARHLVAISRNTANDVRRFYPFFSEEDISVVLCGVDPIFSPAPAAAVTAVREKFGLKKPYFLIVGTRKGLNGYKNAIFPVRTLSGMSEASEVEIVCTGGEPTLEELADFKNVSLRLLSHVAEEDLVALYSGAEALVYPSRYEGFGLPLVEAMACGCPIVTCPNGSIPEVAGEAAVFAGNDQDAEMAAALRKVREPVFRQEMRAKGLERARFFSWKRAAGELAAVLLKAAALPEMPARETLLWQAFRDKEARDGAIKKLLPRRRRIFNLGPYRLLLGISRAKP